MELSSIALLFRIPDLTKGVATYLGVIEAVDKKLEKLLTSDFNAGVRCLREVLVTSPQQHSFLLQEAWRRFHTALTHETGERQALAYLGLALCQDRLGEPSAATGTLDELGNLCYVDKQARGKRVAIATAAVGGGVAITAGVAAMAVASPYLAASAFGQSVAMGIYRSLQENGAAKTTPPTSHTGEKKQESFRLPSWEEAKEGWEEAKRELVESLKIESETSVAQIAEQARLIVRARRTSTAPQ
jgi:hypothetical protein